MANVIIKVAPHITAGNCTNSLFVCVCANGTYSVVNRYNIQYGQVAGNACVVASVVNAPISGRLHRLCAWLNATKPANATAAVAQWLKTNGNKVL